MRGVQDIKTMPRAERKGDIIKGGGEQPHTGNKLAAYQRGEGKGRGK